MLSPERRQQLDAIVLDLARQDAPQEVVRAIVDDFKAKYANETVPATEPANTAPSVSSPIDTSSYSVPAEPVAPAPTQEPPAEDKRLDLTDAATNLYSGAWNSGIGQGIVNTARTTTDLAKRAFSGIASGIGTGAGAVMRGAEALYNTQETTQPLFGDKQAPQKVEQATEKIAEKIYPLKEQIANDTWGVSKLEEEVSSAAAKGETGIDPVRRGKIAAVSARLGEEFGRAVNQNDVESVRALQQQVLRLADVAQKERKRAPEVKGDPLSMLAETLAAGAEVAGPMIDVAAQSAIAGWGPGIAAKYALAAKNIVEAAKIGGAVQKAVGTTASLASWQNKMYGDTQAQIVSALTPLGATEEEAMQFARDHASVSSLGQSATEQLEFGLLSALPVARGAIGKKLLETANAYIMGVGQEGIQGGMQQAAIESAKKAYLDSVGRGKEYDEKAALRNVLNATGSNAWESVKGLGVLSAMGGGVGMLSTAASMRDAQNKAKAEAELKARAERESPANQALELMRRSAEAQASRQEEPAPASVSEPTPATEPAKPVVGRAPSSAADEMMGLLRTSAPVSREGVAPASPDDAAMDLLRRNLSPEAQAAFEAGRLAEQNKAKAEEEKPAETTPAKPTQEPTIPEPTPTEGAPNVADEKVQAEGRQGEVIPGVDQQIPLWATEFIPTPEEESHFLDGVVDEKKAEDADAAGMSERIDVKLDQKPTHAVAPSYKDGDKKLMRVLSNPLDPEKPIITLEETTETAPRQLAPQRVIDRNAKYQYGHVVVFGSEIDGMTGIPGATVAKTYNEQIPNDHYVIKLDGDFFKAVNETYGHDGGDKVIKAIASLMMKHFGDSNVQFMAREGGEEFFIDVGKQLTRDVVQRAINMVDDAHNVSIDGDPMTISMGLSIGAKPADRAAIISKTRGRNKLTIVHKSVDGKPKFYYYNGKGQAFVPQKFAYDFKGKTIVADTAYRKQTEDYNVERARLDRSADANGSVSERTGGVREAGRVAPAEERYVPVEVPAPDNGVAPGRTVPPVEAKREEPAPVPETVPVDSAFQGIAEAAQETIPAKTEPAEKRFTESAVRSAAEIVNSEDDKLRELDREYKIISAATKYIKELRDGAFGGNTMAWRKVVVGDESLVTDAHRHALSKMGKKYAEEYNEDGGIREGRPIAYVLNIGPGETDEFSPDDLIVFIHAFGRREDIKSRLEENRAKHQKVQRDVIEAKKFLDDYQEHIKIHPEDALPEDKIRPDDLDIAFNRIMPTAPKETVIHVGGPTSGEKAATEAEFWKLLRKYFSADLRMSKKFKIHVGDDGTKIGGKTYPVQPGDLGRMWTDTDGLFHIQIFPEAHYKNGPLNDAERLNAVISTLTHETIGHVGAEILVRALPTVHKALVAKFDSEFARASLAIDNDNITDKNSDPVLVSLLRTSVYVDRSTFAEMTLPERDQARQILMNEWVAQHTVNYLADRQKANLSQKIGMWMRDVANFWYARTARYAKRPDTFTSDRIVYMIVENLRKSNARVLNKISVMTANMPVYEKEMDEFDDIDYGISNVPPMGVQSPVAMEVNDAIYPSFKRSLLQKIKRRLINRNARLEEIEKAVGGGKLLDIDRSPMKTSFLLPGVTGDKVKDAVDTLFTPLQKAIRKQGLDIVDMGRYYTARHTKERNDVIEGRNGGLPTGGSGMTQHQADAIMETAKKNGTAKTYDEFYDKYLMPIMVRYQDLLVDAGQISEETRDKWRTQFQYYVPLEGASFEQNVLNDSEFDNQTEMLMDKNQYSGTFTAEGRVTESDPTEIIPNIVLRLMTGIMRAEREHIKTKFLDNVVTGSEKALAPIMTVGKPFVEYDREYLKSSKGEDLFAADLEAQGYKYDDDKKKWYKEVNPKYRVRFDKETIDKDMKIKKEKTLIWDVDKAPQLAADGTIVTVRDIGEDGKPRRRYLLIHDGHENNLARVFTNTGEKAMFNAEAIRKQLAKFMSFYTMMRTALDPAFLTVNAPRDLQAAWLAYAVEHTGKNRLGRGNIVFDTAMMSKDALIGFSAMSVLSSVKGNKEKFLRRMGGIKSQDTRLVKDILKFLEDGGAIRGDEFGLYGKNNLNMSKVAEKLLSESAKGDTVTAGEVAVALPKMWLGFIGNLNEAAERTTRFVVYRQLVRQGIDSKEAALFARQATVDFNQNGEWTNWLSVAFAFFNPSVQGGYRVYQSAKRNPYKFSMLMASEAVLGGTMAYLARAAMGKGDDGEDLFDSIRQWDKWTRVIISTESHRLSAAATGEDTLSKSQVTVVRIPTAYTWGFAYGLGVQIQSTAARIANGKPAEREIAIATMNALLMAQSTMSPVDALPIPTLLDVGMQYKENKNSFGQSIVLEPGLFPGGGQQAQAYLYKRSAPQWAIDGTQFVHRKIFNGTTNQENWFAVANPWFRPMFSPDWWAFTAETMGGGTAKTHLAMMKNAFDVAKMGDGELNSPKDFGEWAAQTPFAKKFWTSVGANDMRPAFKASQDLYTSIKFDYLGKSPEPDFIYDLNAKEGRPLRKLQEGKADRASAYKQLTSVKTSGNVDGFEFNSLSQLAAEVKRAEDAVYASKTIAERERRNKYYKKLMGEHIRITDIMEAAKK